MADRGVGAVVVRAGAAAGASRRAARAGGSRSGGAAYASPSRLERHARAHAATAGADARSENAADADPAGSRNESAVGRHRLRACAPRAHAGARHTVAALRAGAAIAGAGDDAAGPA